MNPTLVKRLDSVFHLRGRVPGTPKRFSKHCLFALLPMSTFTRVVMFAFMHVRNRALMHVLYKKKKKNVEHWFQAPGPGCVDNCVALLPPKVRVWINWYMVTSHIAYWTLHTENTQLQSQYWHYPCLMSPTSLKTHFKWQHFNRDGVSFICN